MERESVNKTLSLIKDIEKVNAEIETLLSDIQIPSRSDLLKEIVLDIIEENYYIKEHGLSKDLLCESDTNPSKLDSIESILDNLIENIQKYPSKKIIYLRLFLDRFHDISEQDKNVIIQSVKDEKPEALKEKLLSLVVAFKLEL
jgi:hypothetical protein